MQSLSVSQRSVTHLSFQLLCSQWAQQRLTVWIEDRVCAQLSGLTSSWATEAFIKPIEQRDDKEWQPKLQFSKESKQHQPQQEFKQSKVGEDRLSRRQPPSQSTVKDPVTTALQKDESGGYISHV